jgi:hypothetical protein
MTTRSLSRPFFFRPQCHRWVTSAAIALAGVAATVGTAHAATTDEPATRSCEEGHGPSSCGFLSHRFQLAPHSPERLQLGVNFGLVQIGLGGFNVAAELRYERLWLEYSHGQSLDLNALGGFGLTAAERDQNLDVDVPYTTGFGVGVTLVDELWVGVELKTHRFDVADPSGDRVSYQTYSVGPVVGYKLFVWRGLYANAFLRYWPNVATSLDDDQVALGPNGTLHEAHAFNFFANLAVGWAFDL